MKNFDVCYQKSWLCLLLLFVVISTSSQAEELVSTAFRDVIKSNGVGNIDLFKTLNADKTISASILEALRQDNNGKLVFAIDVNEAADGSEKATTQGIAIDQVSLTIIINGTAHVYTLFSTTSRTLVARVGETNRNPYYTVLGDAGSNRVTSNSSSDIYGSSFDATLSVPVDIDISQASAAQLVVKFLDVNSSLGDPEKFYDYSNGYEDIAIVTALDAQYLDQLAAGKSEAPLVLSSDSFDATSPNRLYYPSQNEYYLAAYEDLYPYKGDYDFNDLVVAYRVYVELNDSSQVTLIGGEGFLVARGAGGYDHDWHLRIPLPAGVGGSGNLTVIYPHSNTPVDNLTRPISFNQGMDLKIYKHTYTLWTDEGFAHVNTLPDQNLKAGHHFSFHVNLSQPVDLIQFPAAPYDPYLYVHNTNYEIHLRQHSPVLGYSHNERDGKTSFVDSSGFPFAMILPDTWEVPVEYVDLGAAYPDFLNFITSGNQQDQDWYNKGRNTHIKALNKSTWLWQWEPGSGP